MNYLSSYKLQVIQQIKQEAWQAEGLYGMSEWRIEGRHFKGIEPDHVLCFVTFPSLLEFIIKQVMEEVS